MISATQNLFPAALPATTGEGVSDGNRSNWQASDFNGLFESHLADAGQQFRQSLDASSPGLEEAGISAFPSSPNLAAPARYSGDAGERSVVIPAASGTGEPFEVLEPEPASVAFAGTVQLRSSSPDANEDQSAASLQAGAPETEIERPELRSLVLAGQETPELYVRDGSLDAEAAMALTRAAVELLQEHRLALGRVKINGQQMGGDGEELPPSS